jgi:hypothetical protein
VIRVAALLVLLASVAHADLRVAIRNDVFRRADGCRQAGTTF